MRTIYFFTRFPFLTTPSPFRILFRRRRYDILFTITHKDTTTHARQGILALPHGDVITPAFMPVGTNGTVKALRNEDVEELGFRIILGNAYHLYLRPGLEVIEKAGGLHAFMSWKQNLLTDSGGYQVFSLAPYRKIKEEGVCFRSHIDGSTHQLTPEKVVDIQFIIRSDILMPLDVCTPYPCEQDQAAAAVRMTTRWARRSIDAWKQKQMYESYLFGIVQGNFYRDLREQSASEICGLDFPGIAVGGLSVGESLSEYADMLGFTAGCIPFDKPRYVMGVGTPDYIIEAVENGIDLFDCVYPTRIARNAMVFTSTGTESLRREKHTFDNSPVDPECGCYICRNYSRAYLRHLFKTREINAAVFATYHNLYFMENMMKEIRKAIRAGSFADFKKTFLEKYRAEKKT